MDTLIKALTTMLPFLATCPPWIRLLVILWAAFTVILIVVVLAYYLWIPPPIAILHPSPNEAVEEGAIVEFCSRYSDLHHYIVVTPMRSPSRWVVDGPLRVLHDGRGTGRARFGSGRVGVGEQFAIAVLVSSVLLPEGVLESIPADSKLSKHVTVKRVR